jgi:hypothetical protein
MIIHHILGIIVFPPLREGPGAIPEAELFRTGAIGIPGEADNRACSVPVRVGNED